MDRVDLGKQVTQAALVLQTAGFGFIRNGVVPRPTTDLKSFCKRLLLCLIRQASTIQGPDLSAKADIDKNRG
jgi:hypothetical protein